MPAGSHTFLFMDLVGFTALTAERGDDSAAEVALQNIVDWYRALRDGADMRAVTLGQLESFELAAARLGAGAP